jgi:hypothetical protein
MIRQSSRHAMTQATTQAMTHGIGVRSRQSLAWLGAHTASILALGASAGLSACSAPPADGPPMFDSAGPNGASNSAAGSGSSQTPGRTDGSSNGVTNAGNPAQNQIGSSTPPPANGSSTPPTNTAPESNPNAAPLANGTDQSSGSGMAAGGGGATSTNPAAAAGAGGSGNTTPPVQPPPVPPVQQPPAAPDITCPDGATFCSGFETDTLPTGAGYQSQPTTPLEFDTTVKHSGARALKVVSAGGFNIREVVVPIPGQSFWARLFIQTSNDFGDGDHDSLFVASTATPAQDNNDEHGPEFSEQANQVLLNADDNPIAGANGPGFPQSAGPKLAANTWHCVEAFYDGGSGDVEIFSDNASLIDAPAFKPATFATFRFGYIGFNTVRTVWFDDVVVAPDRVGCN